MTDLNDKVQELMNHIRRVQDNAFILGSRLIKKGDENGKLLIANAMVHDQSKFRGIEWDALVAEKETVSNDLLKLAIAHHNSTNLHHPEYWGKDGIHKMPIIYLQEMLCDWKARSEEFGSSLREWVDGEAMKRYNFTKDGKVYKAINLYMDILLEKPFKAIT